MNVGQRNSRSISVLCPLLGYSRQSFYQGNKAREKEVLQSELIVQKVLEFRKDQKAVGTKKLFVHLQPFFKEHGISMGRDALFALLSEQNLLIRKRKRKTPITTFSNHWMHKYPNLIIGFVATEAHQLLVSDITYVCLSEGRHAYLSLVTDAYSRKIVGYHLNKDLSAEGCVAALKMAIKQLPQTAYAIHHSDRGSQYCSFDYVAWLNKNNIAISMTQSGDPLENAIAERINGTIKNELLKESFDSLKQAKDAIAHSISVYNNIRLHLSIDMLTPSQAHYKTGELKRHWKSYYKRFKEVHNVE
jgi:putative transposase